MRDSIRTHTPLAAFQVSLGGVAYAATLAAAQALQLRLGVTTATPLLPNLLGLGTVGAASVLSLRAADLAARALPPVEGSRRSRPSDGSTAAAAALLGALLFKTSGGRFWAISPSSLSRPGAFARAAGSLPAGLEYATRPERAAIQQLGRRFGCHSCGVRFNVESFTADHIPPLSEVRRANRALWRRLLHQRVAQRFYPQCTACSGRQAAALSTVRRGVAPASTAVFHAPSVLRPADLGGAVLVAVALCAEQGVAAAQQLLAAAEGCAEWLSRWMARARDACAT